MTLLTIRLEAALIGDAVAEVAVTGGVTDIGEYKSATSSSSLVDVDDEASSLIRFSASACRHSAMFNGRTVADGLAGFIVGFTAHEGLTRPAAVLPPLLDG